jgi:hypothetical protein
VNTRHAAVIVDASSISFQLVCAENLDSAILVMKNRREQVVM